MREAFVLTQLLGLPYQMTIDPMWKKMYPLGYYRPGECAPKLHYQVPWNTRAAINQANANANLTVIDFNLPPAGGNTICPPSSSPTPSTGRCAPSRQNRGQRPTPTDR